MGSRARLKAFIIIVKAGTVEETFYILAPDGAQARTRAIALMRQKRALPRGSIAA
jgi:hypothetical protein